MARLLKSTNSMHRLFSSSAAKVINIPPRIERGPTDILKALASAVGRDHTAPSYTFVDDPALEPLGIHARRTYAISREQGRKAAKYFLDNYPDLFYRNDAEPKIPAFDPPDRVTADIKCVEEDIIASIQGTQVLNAIQCYKNCIENKVPVSPATEQMLLELCCFSNSQDLEYEWLQEKWYEPSPGQRKINIWHEDSFAETLFQKIGENDASVNCMICGYTKSGSCERAHALYQRSRELDISLSVDAFNSLFSCISHISSSGEGRQEMILHFLSEMKRNQVKPNAETFVNILDVLYSTLVWRECRSFALKVFNEMVHLKIDPPLASFYHLLNIFTDTRSGPPEPNIIYSIMPFLKAQLNAVKDDSLFDGKLPVKHLRDGSFFTLAMVKTSQMLSDLDLARELHEIVISNQHCFDSAISEAKYYREFFHLLSKVGTSDELLDMYETLVPHTYVPDTELYSEIIESIAVEGREELIPRFMSDLTFYHNLRDKPDASKMTRKAKTREPTLEDEVD